MGKRIYHGLTHYLECGYYTETEIKDEGKTHEIKQQMTSVAQMLNFIQHPQHQSRAGYSFPIFSTFIVETEQHCYHRHHSVFTMGKKLCMVQRLSRAFFLVHFTGILPVNDLPYVLQIVRPHILILQQEGECR